jgi:hypothetical protein
MPRGRELFVILVPGADARRFDEDIAVAEAHGAGVETLCLPPPGGHPIDARRPYFEAVAGRIAGTVARARLARPGACIGGIGRNHGGSLLAYAQARGAGLDGLVLAGAIPALSRFRAESAHASARAFRAALEARGENERIAETAVLDLTASLRRIDPEDCLLQVGHRDDWMEASSQRIFLDLDRRFPLVWYDDDHAMAAASTVAARWAFLRRLARQPVERPAQSC